MQSSCQFTVCGYSAQMMILGCCLYALQLSAL